MSNEHQLIKIDNVRSIRWACKQFGCGWTTDEPSRERARNQWRSAHKVSGETTPTQVRIPPDEKDPAVALATKKGETLTDVIRRALREYVEKELAK